MARPKPETDPKTPTRSEGTGRYLACPRAVELHPQLLTACHVLRGPKTFWFECSVCGTREYVAPKILKADIVRDRTRAYGITLDQALAQGLTPLP